MKLKKKEKKAEAITATYSLSLSVQMKEKLRELKLERGIDVNGMTRDFLYTLIRHADNAS